MINRYKLQCKRKKVNTLLVESEDRTKIPFTGSSSNLFSYELSSFKVLDQKLKVILFSKGRIKKKQENLIFAYINISLCDKCYLLFRKVYHLNSTTVITEKTSIKTIFKVLQ